MTGFSLHHIPFDQTSSFTGRIEWKEEMKETDRNRKGEQRGHNKREITTNKPERPKEQMIIITTVISS
jgi:hypothetical protein